MRTDNVDNPQAFNHRFAAVNGIRMHYVDEGQGPLVVLLHGYPFLWYLWRHQIKALAAAGYHVVAPDQRGYGQTECPPDVDSYDITHVAGDVVGLMKALGSESAVLVGQDWGSPVVYNTALMRPDLVRGVLMMCSPPSARGPVRPSEAMKPSMPSSRTCTSTSRSLFNQRQKRRSRGICGGSFWGFSIRPLDIVRPTNSLTC